MQRQHETEHKFFFYDTLSHQAPNSVAASLHQKLNFIQPASAMGRLYAIPHRDGYYPALLADAAGYPVQGNLYVASKAFTQANLNLLDRYEEFHPDDWESSEYLRQRLNIAVGGRKTVDADVYLYNAALPPEAIEIQGGCFVTFIREHGLRVFSGDTGTHGTPSD